MTVTSVVMMVMPAISLCEDDEKDRRRRLRRVYGVVLSRRSLRLLLVSLACPRGQDQELVPRQGRELVQPLDRTPERRLGRKPEQRFDRKPNQLLCQKPA